MISGPHSWAHFKTQTVLAPIVPYHKCFRKHDMASFRVFPNLLYEASYTED